MLPASASLDVDVASTHYVVCERGCFQEPAEAAAAAAQQQRQPAGIVGSAPAGATTPAEPRLPHVTRSFDFSEVQGVEAYWGSMQFSVTQWSVTRPSPLLHCFPFDRVAEARVDRTWSQQKAALSAAQVGGGGVRVVNRRDNAAGWGRCWLARCWLACSTISLAPLLLRMLLCHLSVPSAA